MIRHIRNKYILSSMLALVIVLTVIMGAFHLIHYIGILRDADSMLAYLAENDGHFPEKMFREEFGEPPPPPEGEGGAAASLSFGDSSAGNIPPSSFSGTSGDNGSSLSPDTPPGKPDGPQNQPLESFRKKRDLPELTEETPYITRYFTVTLGTDGAISKVDTGNIAAIDSEKASSYAAELFSDGRKKGFYGKYRYYRDDLDDCFMYLFYDCGPSLSSFRSLLISSLFVCVAGIAAFLGLTILLSRPILRPVTESYEKQKQFITDAGHEIRTPLSIIDANTEVQEMLHGEDEWSQSNRRQIRRLTELTNELIMLSRMEENSPAALKADNFNLSALLAETVQDFEALAASSQKEIETAIDPGLLCRGDPAAIAQLISILMDNAVKYTPPCETIHVSLVKKGRSLQLSVRNPAENLSRGRQNRLFERFYRADSSRSSQTGGHGIGLSIALAIVENHKGRITAESPDGRSLVITALLPAAAS